MLTRREKLLIRPWQQRRYNHHRRKIQSALPAIDVGPPAQHGHVCCKLKKQQSEQERTARIERDNYRLLQRMGTIMRTNRLDNHWDSPPPRRGLSVAEALEIICKDDIDGDLFVEPPDPNIDTDEDSGNEDEGGFLHRVGIYYEPPLCTSQSSSEVESPESTPEQPSSRKTRCLACNPQQIKTMKSTPDERIPWIKSPSSTISAATTRTQTSASSTHRSNTLRHARAPRHISLAHGDLHLDVSFPADSTVQLEDGLFKRVLQREFCECKALQQ